MIYNIAKNFNILILIVIFISSLIIDDGTSVAMVTCSDKEVQILLLLSDDQWEALKLSVKQHGEVFLQQVFEYFIL